MKSKRMVLSAILLAACIAPTALVARRAFAGDDAEGNDDGPGEAMSSADVPIRQQLVLRALAADHDALINVTSREMPASPDILNLGRKAAPALARCVSDNVDDHLRATCATLLGRLGDKSALPALHGALEAWDADVRHAAITALRKMPDKSSFAPLAKILDREDEEAGNRAAALDALGVLSDGRAVPILYKRLRDKSEDAGVRAAAFRGLWKSRHIMARATVVSFVSFALTSDEAQLALPATFVASELRAPELVGSLVKLMTSPSVQIRNRAVYALGKIGDPAAKKALLDQIPKVRESRMLNNIAFALERLDAPAFYQAARGLITHKQAQIRFNTAFVLGDVRRPEGLSLLEGALADRNDSVRINAVSAIGKLDAPEGAKVLERFVDDPNPNLQRAAIYAIYALSGMERKDLVFDKLYAGPRPEEKLPAAIALGRGNDPRVIPDLLSCVELRSCPLVSVEPALRAAKSPEVPGRMLVSWVKGRPELTDLVGSLKPTGGTAIAVSEVQAELARKNVTLATSGLDLAGDLGEQKALEVLRPLLAHENMRLRTHAAVALARAGEPAALPVLFADAENMPHEQLPSFARLLGRVNEPAARARLLPEVQKRAKGKDADVALAFAAVDLEWEPEVAIFRMLEALASSERHERDLAEKYLVQSKPPVVTELLRRALARESRLPVQNQLRRILDLRAGAIPGQRAPQ